jgi:Na+-transporting NADH:ubiquinone oxidoreductase subunit NqrB
MLTDPRSIPNARVGRLLWAGCIAGVAFILRNQFFISTAVFWALFVLSPLSVLLDWIWQSPQFSWNDTARNTANYPSIAKPLQPINSKII